MYFLLFTNEKFHTIKAHSRKQGCDSNVIKTEIPVIFPTILLIIIYHHTSFLIILAIVLIR